MDVLFEIIAEIFFQIVIEVIVEGLITLIDKLTGGRLRIRKNVVTYVFLMGIGFLLGWGSLEIYGIVLKTRELQIANLLITPVLAGALMHLIGKVKEKKGKPGLVLDKFLNGYLFALFFALGRFVWQFD